MSRGALPHEGLSISNRASTLIPVDTIIVGAGPGGLVTSYLLSSAKRDHVVLERGRVGEHWRSQRWDSLRVVGPNWNQRLLGEPFAGSDPDDFMSRDEMVGRLEKYASAHAAPVRTGACVEKLVLAPDGSFCVHSSAGSYVCSNVIVATGAFSRSTVPHFAAKLPSSIAQLTSSSYTSERALPAGSVLIVGSGQSGCQIAEELSERGRRVYLSVGRCWWRPRRYRGKDTIRWAVEMGKYDATVSSLPGGDPRNALPPPIQTGAGGGRDLSLHTLAARGVRLVGRMIDCVDGTGLFAGDLRSRILEADRLSMQVKAGIDRYIAEHALTAGDGDWPEATAALAQIEKEPPCESLHFASSDINAVIWATGLKPDLAWLEVPIFNVNGARLNISAA